MDPLSSPVVDELHPPNDVVARRSASGPAGTPTPKPLPETDEYGFFLRPGRKSMKKQDGPTADEFRLLEQKWLGIISSSTLASVQKNKKNKKLVRSGLPASLRGRIWAFLLESQTQRRQGLFDQLCVVSPATSEMEEAASRAFSDHEQFNEPNSGRHDLLAVLRSYAQLNQPLGLQYGMGQIAGTLLMAAPAEDAFWLFASVVDSIRNLYKKDLAVESLVFVYLLESLDKPLAKRIIVDCKIDPEMIISQWLQPMFVRTLPFATVLRIWDVSFFEGPSYLLRVALAIVLSAKGRLMDQKAMTSVEHIKLYLLTPPHDHLLSADTLIPIADGLKISTKEEDLRKLRSKAMMALEEGRAAIRAARRAAGLATTPTTPGGSNYKR
ncbi:rab-GTPase-TBC domain-containing protein [Mrakia frigida]|uniref:rab-GTPase-TBC domain-containing protein n=1 Tax=Mrakia frigida TaxID=29902 RepID=UPI003FCC1EBB